MASLVAPTATPLDRVPDLGESIIAKLHEASITTVEALADMTPEQLEELPGVGPKTVEKISLAVNNYYSSLDAAPAGEAPATQEAAGAPEAQTDEGQAAEAAPAEAGETTEPAAADEGAGAHAAEGTGEAANEEPGGTES